MLERNDIAGRLKYLREQALDLSQREFAYQLGVSPGLIGQVEAGHSGLSLKLQRTLQERFRVNPLWLSDAQLPIFLQLSQSFKGRTAFVEPPDYSRAGHGDVRIDGHDCVRIRRMDLSVSAGSGVVAVEGPDAAPILVPVGWMQRLRVNEDLTVLVRVQGDSMAPTIQDGSYVLIHLIEKTVDQAGIYAFTRDGEAFIKRLIPSDLNIDGRHGTIMVMSDNPAFPPFALTGNRLNELRIVGRVRAVFSTL